jgi:hypothetical protein
MGVMPFDALGDGGTLCMRELQVARCNPVRGKAVCVSQVLTWDRFAVTVA